MKSPRVSVPYARNQLLQLCQLPQELEATAQAAVEAMRRSYSPYSNFAVGAALLHADHAITAGCNYENCTLQSCCAERCAIVRANVEGRRTARAIAIYGTPRQAPESSEETSAAVFCPPCGLCRQLLVEVADLSGNLDSFEVVLVARDREHVKVMRLADLIPHKFGPADMGMDIAQLREN
ncbi:unnamed protein product [Phytomonas sp. EM1]|nr:unnamed protein product [Phytomonas sp. EM1]|eukprot:CCW63963.1 unnamed protein product [Phytomonas sp. isolate EM1]